MIGFGKIQWCEDFVFIVLQCVCIMDWYQFGDNNVNLMFYIIGGFILDVVNEDFVGVVILAGFMVDSDLFLLGGICGFWVLGMDVEVVGQYVQSSFIFGILVDDLSFFVLGIDQLEGVYQDKVSVYGFLYGIEVFFFLNDIMLYFGMYNNQVVFLNVNEYELQGMMFGVLDFSGNLWVYFVEKVDFVVVCLEIGV